MRIFIQRGNSVDKLFGLLFFSTVILPDCFGQNDSLVSNLAAKKQKNILSLNVGVHDGFVFAHSRQVEFTKGSRPIGIELGISWQRNDTQTVNICNCYPRKSFLIAHYNMDNAILGKVYNIAYFLEPTYRSAEIYFCPLGQ